MLRSCVMPPFDKRKEYESKKQSGEEWDEPNVILERGTRSSTPDYTMPSLGTHGVDAVDFLMEIMNNRLQERMKRNRKPKTINITPREERLRGLFGGNRRE